MKFKYKKKKLYANLVIGILFLIIGVSSIYLDDFEFSSNQIFFAFGLVYIGYFFYNYKFQYIRVKNGIIQENGLFGTKLEIAEITSFKKFAGDYILKAGKKELRINTELIDADSLQELREFIVKLDIQRK